MRMTPSRADKLAVRSSNMDDTITCRHSLSCHQCGTIYNITCDIDSSHTYIGETKRTLCQRFKENTNLDKPTVGDHCRATGHSVSMKNTKVLTRESKKSEGGYVYQTLNPYHEQRPGIPTACPLHPNYLAEI